ncbi:hypothetical protein [Pseudomonas xanthosomatis]|uniref:hypothetical protein n=1 Tax=Pseudomonas xanthosomatis TaxID=2842356 RepID=UPI0035181BB4
MMLDVLYAWLLEPKNWIPSPITTMIGLLALAVAISNYRRKSGIDIAGSYECGVDRRTDQPFVSELRLENRKDRAVTIYFVFLKLGENIYIELQNHESNPLILKAFESYRGKLDMVAGYTSRARFVNISKALLDSSVKKELILATGSGKYKVVRKIKHWHARNAFFNRAEVSLINPLVISWEGQVVGNRTRFFVEVTSNDGRDKSVIGFPSPQSELPGSVGLLISPGDYETVERLGAFLEKSKKRGDFPPSASFEIMPNPHYSDPENGIKGELVRAQGVLHFRFTCMREFIKRIFAKRRFFSRAEIRSPQKIGASKRSLTIWFNR